MPSVGTPIVWMPCPVATVTRLKSESHACVRKRLPSMCRVGGMYFTGQSGNSSRVSCAWAHSYSRPLTTGGSISNASPSAICSSATPESRASCRLMNCDAVTDDAAASASAVRR